MTITPRQAAQQFTRYRAAFTMAGAGVAFVMVGGVRAVVLAGLPCSEHNSEQGAL